MTVRSVLRAWDLAPSGRTGCLASCRVSCLPNIGQVVEKALLRWSIADGGRLVW